MLTFLSHFLDPSQETIYIVEKLSHYEVGAGINFCFEIVQLYILVVFFVRVTIGIG